MRLPDPIVSEYYVRRLKYTVDETGTLGLMWITPHDEVVNTVDIESVLRQPNTYMTGWLETHYDTTTRGVSGGGVAEMPKEYHIRQHHPFNPGIVTALSARISQGLQTPKTRSYEAILFDLGWQFNIKPIGQDVEAWEAFVIPDTIKLRLADQPEFKMTAETDVTLPQEAKPAEDVVDEDPIEQRIKMVECSIAALSDAVTRVVSMLETSTDAPRHNGSSNGQPRSPGVERNPDTVPEFLPNA